MQRYMTLRACCNLSHCCLLQFITTSATKVGSHGCQNALSGVLHVLCAPLLDPRSMCTEISMLPVSVVCCMTLCDSQRPDQCNLLLGVSQEEKESIELAMACNLAAAQHTITGRTAPGRLLLPVLLLL